MDCTSLLGLKQTWLQKIYTCWILEIIFFAIAVWKGKSYLPSWRSKCWTSEARWAWLVTLWLSQLTAATKLCNKPKVWHLFLRLSQLTVVRKLCNKPKKVWHLFFWLSQRTVVRKLCNKPNKVWHLFFWLSQHTVVKKIVQ